MTAVVAWLAAGCGSPPSPGTGAESAPTVGTSVDWPHYGNDLGGTRFSPLTDLDRQTVEDLHPVWTWRTGEDNRHDDRGALAVPGTFQVTPLAISDTLYLSTPFNQAVALDAETGRELWRFDPAAHRQPMPPGRGAFVHRGLAAWTSGGGGGGGGGGRRIFLNTRGRLIALDASSGRPIPSFGVGGEVDLTAHLPRPVNRGDFNQTSPPLVFERLVIVGSSISDFIVHPNDPPGDVQAFDAETGRFVWRWSPVPAPGEPGRDSWPPGAAETAGHLNTWAPMSADSARGLLYLPVSAASNDWYGGARHGENRHAESLVCLTIRTGRLVWSFQMVHHGLWDYDPAGQPVLMTVRQDGRLRDVVALAGKTGFVYAFDRQSGEPLWPIDERPVPTSTVPGEMAHPTQPIPTRPPPFAKQGFDDSDVVDFTPEIRRLAMERLAGLRRGALFTPPSLEGTIVMPGWIGGAGWGNGAFDQATSTFYVKATNRPALGRLVAGRVNAKDGATVARYQLDPSRTPSEALDFELERHGGVGGLLRRADPPIPINRPPYGTMTAIDMDRGEHRWQVVFGDLPRLRHHPWLRDLRLPPLGVPGAPGPIVTAGGLLFATGGGNVLYALDTRDGRVVWENDLGDFAYSTPMTFRSRSGRQFVVVAVGIGDRAKLVGFAVRPARPDPRKPNP